MFSTISWPLADDAPKPKKSLSWCTHNIVRLLWIKISFIILQHKRVHNNCFHIGRFCVCIVVRLYDGGVVEKLLGMCSSVLIDMCIPRRLAEQSRTYMRLRGRILCDLWSMMVMGLELNGHRTRVSLVGWSWWLWMRFGSLLVEWPMVYWLESEWLTGHIRT